jgi:Protein of unknown function (DUF3147)
MRIEIDPSALKKTRWYEFAVRFLFGGLITAATGLIAKKFGPGVGGLFLAFPAIFPASATLIEKHEKQKKERAGLHGSARQKSSGRGCRRRRHRKSRAPLLRLAGPAVATRP